MPDRRALRFVKLQLSGEVAVRDGGTYRIGLGSNAPSISLDFARKLAAAGVLDLSQDSCRARPEARTWLRRQLAEAEEAQRNKSTAPPLPAIDLNESPLARLARPRKGAAPYLAPHQIEAGERVRMLVERGHLNQRVTMSYDPNRLPSTGGGQRGDVGAMALDARRELNKLLMALPADCAGVVLDVCGHLKGLQRVETERRWPRRSAKLVLRIGLDQTASWFGLQEVAEGTETRRRHAWLGEDARPMELG